MHTLYLPPRTPTRTAHTIDFCFLTTKHKHRRRMLSHQACGLFALLAFAAAWLGVSSAEERPLLTGGEFHRGQSQLGQSRKHTRGVGEAEPEGGGRRGISTTTLHVNEGEFVRQVPSWASSAGATFPPSSRQQHQRRRAADSCEDGDPFSISSLYVPAADGCYFDTYDTTTDYEIIYTPSGAADVGQMWMFTSGIIGYTTIHWWLSYVTAITDTGLILSAEDYCVSNDQASLYHPADVPSWSCDTDFDVSEDNFGVTCDGGCSPSPSTVLPSPTPEPAPETPEPTEVPTPEPPEAFTPAPTPEPPTPAPATPPTPSPTAMETPEPTAASTPSPIPEPPTPVPVTPPTPSPTTVATPEPTASSSSTGREIEPVPSPAPADDMPEPTSSPQAPVADGSGVVVSQPPATSSPAGAAPLLGGTPAPADPSNTAQDSDTVGRCAPWSVVATSVAVVVAAVATAVEW